uniref:hypothetical protein n=1 Tax=Altererythrobacter segetis TaxID=1104773 RepID=UPI001408F370|nr:hypothetical protein [Altererythrobacter segetis]
MALDDPTKPADPLETRPAPERVNYATGVMLQADDFEAEQTYHRGRLAQLACYLLGSGTLAGLNVGAPEAGDNLLELKVEPGVAIDRLGRLIEISSAQCIRLASWFAAQDGRYLRAATHDSPKVPLPQAVVADVFLSAGNCGRGKTPSFASGPFDALDALVPARIAETGHLELVLRMEGNPDPDGGPGVPGDVPVPKNFWPGPGANADAIRKAVLGSWDIGFSTNAGETLDGLQEHVPGKDPSAILLARVMIPVALDRSGPATLSPTLDPTEQVAVDQSIRPLIYFSGKWLGHAPA